MATRNGRVCLVASPGLIRALQKPDQIKPESNLGQIGLLVSETSNQITLDSSRDLVCQGSLHLSPEPDLGEPPRLKWIPEQA